jgi:hypothetical protein
MRAKDREIRRDENEFREGQKLTGHSIKLTLVLNRLHWHSCIHEFAECCRLCRIKRTIPCVNVEHGRTANIFNTLTLCCKFRQSDPFFVDENFPQSPIFALSHSEIVICFDATGTDCDCAGRASCLLHPINKNSSAHPNVCAIFIRH